ncbi:MAG TPA: DUF305 domain-containing protein [Gemmatimonadaceae bacterium]|nr:DUF305 domain-containing protein [Gemmatimonadaceae bacterium]
MRASHPSSAVLAALVSVCAGTSCLVAQAPSVDPSEAAAIAQAQADSARYPYTDADIKFMSGMIPHHAQAIVMAGWAPSHGASPSVQTLCARIINAQRDEIHLMQTWLRDRRQPVPQPDSAGTVMMNMNGMQMAMVMPGMLTPEQMKQLNAARGQDFDRLFLQFMIQHRKGAVSMVNDLFASNGAAQDLTVFKLATGINVDQTTEIARMQRMLADILFGGGSPSQ